MRALCVGRHRYLSEHLAALFTRHEMDCCAAVGVEEAVAAARINQPDVVIADYDLIATIPLDQWERDPVLALTPVIAVSLTRRPDEVNLMDVNGIGGFLYLPSMTDDEVRRVFNAVRRVPAYRPDLGLHPVSTAPVRPAHS